MPSSKAVAAYMVFFISSVLKHFPSTKQIPNIKAIAQLPSNIANQFPSTQAVVKVATKKRRTYKEVVF